MVQPWRPQREDMIARQMAADALTAAQAATQSVGGRLTACRFAAGKTGAALLVGGSTDVTISWKSPSPSAVYTVEAVEGPGLIGTAALAVKSQTAAGCVITVTAQVAVAVGAMVLAHAYI